MNDSENLSKLLGHLQPASFRQFLQDEFGLAMPVAELQQSKRAQRQVLATALATLAVPERRQLDAAAEELLLLADGPGQDVMAGFGADRFSAITREAFETLPNQYERALWLSLHQPALFREALDARQADIFRQSARCYSGFLAPTHLRVLDTPAARDTFRQQVAELFGCALPDVALQLFKRLRPDTASGEAVEMYQISVQHNRPPELIDCVEDSELVAKTIVRALATHITYEPANGHLEVLSKQTTQREALARLVAETLLQSPLSGVPLQLKYYAYQSLAAPRDFDLSGEEIMAVKVTELGYAGSHQRTLLVKIGAREVGDIYTAARALIGPSFDFRHHQLNYAQLSIRLRKGGRQRARTVTVVLRGDNQCNIKTKREKDRALCDRLLVKWQLLQDLMHDRTGTPYRLAA